MVEELKGPRELGSNSKIITISCGILDHNYKRLTFPKQLGCAFLNIIALNLYNDPNKVALLSLFYK